MRPRLLTVGTLAVGGGLAGLAGTIEILGVAGYMPAAYATNIGFDAITVALIGRANPFGVLFGALLLGALRAGAASMQIQAGIPVEMIDVLQGVMLFFLAADVIVSRVFRLRRVEGGVDELATISRSYGGQDDGALMEALLDVPILGLVIQLLGYLAPSSSRTARSSWRSPRRSPWARCAAS